jgi:hypothetical protein
LERLTITGIEKLMGMRIGLLVFPYLRIYDVNDVVSTTESYMLVLGGDITLNIHRQFVTYKQDVSKLWVRMELVPTYGVHKPIGYGEMEYEKMLSIERFIAGLKEIEWKP